MKTVRIGLIGCGRIASQHVEGYQKADGVQISALCAPRLEKAYALADKYGLQDVEFFADYRDMIAQKGIVNAVDIMTPDYLHAPITIDCAEAGLHILCETNLYATFVRCLQTGIQARPDFRDGLICQKILDAMDDSIQTGRAMSLDDEFQDKESIVK